VASLATDEAGTGVVMDLLLVVGQLLLLLQHCNRLARGLSGVVILERRRSSHILLAITTATVAIVVALIVLIFFICGFFTSLALLAEFVGPLVGIGGASNLYCKSIIGDVQILGIFKKTYIKVRRDMFLQDSFAFRAWDF
jgi:hypothetical protein